MRKIPEYLPWSKSVREYCFLEYQNGKLPCIDMETSTLCVHGTCVYCDSDSHNYMALPHEMEYNAIEQILIDGADLGTKWLHLCSLGEPSDDPNIIRIIEKASELGMRVSMFTNGIEYSEDILRTLYANEVCIIIKLDSLNANTFDDILGRKGTAKKIYKTIDLLLECGYAELCNKNVTPLAASIVPTKGNATEILDVVKFCCERNIFPSIGELENSGRARNRYEEFNVSHEILQELKKEVDAITGFNYERPLCPAGIAGIHITSAGRIVVDRCTGISCQWFMLNGPDLYDVGHVSDITLRSAMQKIREYRKVKRNNTMRLLDCNENNVFGGCGGKIEKVLRHALQMLEQ